MSSDVAPFPRRPPSRHPRTASKPSDPSPAPTEEVPASPPAPASPLTTPPPSSARRRRPAAAPPQEPEPPSVVTWSRLRRAQVDRISEILFVGNRELEDQARAAGQYRVEHRLTDSDFMRFAVDHVLAHGGWPELRAELLRVAGEMRKRGRPPAKR